MSETKLKLTSAQRRAFFSRDRKVARPTLAGEGKCPVEVGYVHRLSSRVSFEVTKVSHKHGKWSIEYHVTDDREEWCFLLPTARTLATDRAGKLLPMAPEEEIGYTRNPKLRHADEVRSVPPDVQNVIDMQAKLTRAQRPVTSSEKLSQMRSFKERLRETMDSLTPTAQTALLASLERTLTQAQDGLDEAA